MAPRLLDDVRARLDAFPLRFYVGSVEGTVVSNIIVAGGTPAAILGHVSTHTAFRRRGASRALMTAQMAHTRRVGPAVLTLGADPQGHAFRMYASFSLRPFSGDGSFMLWERERGAALALVDQPLGEVRPMHWSDYGLVNLLAMWPVAADEELPRSPLLHINSVWDVEDSFLKMQSRRTWQGLGPSITRLALTGQAPGGVVGWALLVPDDQWFHDQMTLDLYVHAGHADRGEGYRHLVAALPHEPCPVSRGGSCAPAADAGHVRSLWQRRGSGLRRPCPTGCLQRVDHGTPRSSCVRDGRALTGLASMMNNSCVARHQP